MNKSDLNKEQQEAVHTVNGRVLILAGAGSGKTSVLTERIVYLILEQHIPPDSILGLTFTNKAAQEMRERIASRLSPQLAKKVTLSTFHSFCMQILRSDIHHLGFTEDFSLYDEKDLLRMVKLITVDLLNHEGELPSLTATLATISKANHSGFLPTLPPKPSWHDRFVKDLYGRLRDSLRAYNAVDFDHLLLLTVELFTKYPQVLAKYQDRFRYVMIDEYQDTNPIQFQLAELLTHQYGNLCVVGDDDQSIYGWRGADVKNILQFNQAKVIKLEQNYRSSNTILKAANQIIQNNQSRYSKALWSKKGEGEKIEVFVAPTEIEEGEAVAARLIKLKEKEGMAWGDMAILYRSNALSRSFEIALLKAQWNNQGQSVRGIPYEIVGGTEFYERREVKDLMAYLRAICNPLDEEALLRVINLPRRGIGDVMLDKMTEVSRKDQIPLFQVFESAALNQGMWSGQFSKKSTDSLKDFVSMIKEAQERYRREALAETTRWLLTRTKFKKSIEEEVKSDKMRAFKWENIEEFVSSLGEYEKTKKETAKLADFVSLTTLDFDQHLHASNKQGKDKVHLMTFHSAKGLEFESCFLVGMEDHLIPHEKSLKETGIEEERRLMYVAVTRAKRKLTICMAKQRKRMGKDAVSKPSRFIFEIPKELLLPVEWHDV